VSIVSAGDGTGAGCCTTITEGAAVQCMTSCTALRAHYNVLTTKATLNISVSPFPRRILSTRNTTHTETKTCVQNVVFPTSLMQIAARYEQ
jgi:hypothetical protein